MLSYMTRACPARGAQSTIDLGYDLHFRGHGESVLVSVMRLRALLCTDSYSGVGGGSVQALQVSGVKLKIDT